MCPVSLIVSAGYDIEPELPLDLRNVMLHVSASVIKIQQVLAGNTFIR